MSLYDPVTPARLQQFLARLGREVREPGRVYLVGGTGLMYQGLKGLTKDVDLDTPRARGHVINRKGRHT